MKEPSTEPEDPRTVAKFPSHLSGGEQTKDSPFESPPITIQLSPAFIAATMDLYSKDKQPKWTNS